jgi:hypothetical protein
MPGVFLGLTGVFYFFKQYSDRVNEKEVAAAQLKHDEVGTSPYQQHTDGKFGTF